MEAPTLDTSGLGGGFNSGSWGVLTPTGVEAVRERRAVAVVPYFWGNIGAFAQGVVLAIAEQVGATRFDQFATETLARIMEDCRSFCAPTFGCETDYAQQRDTGRFFWQRRNNGGIVQPPPGRTYPPLTPYLGDDGKVYLRDGSDAA